MKPPTIRFVAMAKKVTATSKSQNVLGPNDMSAVLPTQAPVARNSWEVDFLRPACSDVSVRVSTMYCLPYKMLSVLYMLRRAFWKVKDALHAIYFGRGLLSEAQKRGCFINCFALRYDRVCGE